MLASGHVSAFGQDYSAKRTMSPVYASAHLAELKTILAKLRESMASMKELDDLEQVGMPASEVDLMRQALKQKINEMTSEALLSIKRL